MRRYYLVQDWYLDKDGESILKCEFFYKTEVEARFFAERLKRRLNRYHSVDIVVLVEQGRFIDGKNYIGE